MDASSKVDAPRRCAARAAAPAMSRRPAAQMSESPSESAWRFWRKVFTAACYCSLMSIMITASIVAPIFSIAGPGCAPPAARPLRVGHSSRCLRTVRVSHTCGVPPPAARCRFGLNLSQIAVVFSVYYLPNVVSSLAAGVLASLLGRRRVLAAGCTTLSVGCVVLGLVPAACAGLAAGPAVEPGCLYGLFVAARVLQGVGCALSQTCLFAMLADLWPLDTGKVTPHSCRTGRARLQGAALATMLSQWSLCRVAAAGDGDGRADGRPGVWDRPACRYVIMPL